LTAVTAAAFSDANTKMTTADPAKIGGLWLEPGDILMQRSNTPDLVGTSAIYQGCPDWAIFPDLLIRIRFDCRVLPEYAALVLMSQAVRGYLKRSAKGLAGSMPKIDQPTINSIRFPLAAIDDQARVIKEITAQYDSVDRLEKALDTSRKRAESLKLSLLAAAVAGKLVPQDPVDGSAAELLARAKIERDDRPKTLRARKATATRKVAAPSKTTIVPTGIQGELAL
jgi:type I restriction enzyme S subunit